eukprot:7149610-Prymnesium_polylepis.1
MALGGWADGRFGPQYAEDQEATSEHYFGHFAHEYHRCWGTNTKRSGKSAAKAQRTPTSSPSDVLSVSLGATHTVEPERAALVLPPPVWRVDRHLEHSPQRRIIGERVCVRDDDGVVPQLAAKLVREFV